MKARQFEIPIKYRVGGQEVTISNVPNLEGKLGECCLASGYIKIADTFRGGLQSDSSKNNTFLHEMVHTILDNMGRSELSEDEIFVSTFAGSLYEIILSAEYKEKDNGK